jgi:drug/metabolite transporter (DMT)-like permease
LAPLDFGLVLGSALLHAWWSASIKSSRDPLLFNLLQGVTSLALAIVVLPLLHWSEIPAPVWAWLGVTALAHTVYLLWMSRAFELGDLTLVYPIARSTPALLPLLAVPLLGERLSSGGALGIGVVVAGMWLVHAGPGLRLPDLRSPAAGYAWLTLAATVVYSLADKAAMSGLSGAAWTSPVPRAVAWYALLALACHVLYTPLVLRRRSLADVAACARGELRLAAFASAVSFVGYTLILKALESAPASYVVAVRQTSVLFAVLIGVLKLRERPGRPRVLGAVATVAGVALIALYGD